MQIRIATRLRPFVHRPGVSLLIPGTEIVATVYPTVVELSDQNGGRQILNVENSGSVSAFTVQQDLERGCIVAFGKSGKDHFRFYLAPTDDRKGAVLEYGKPGKIFIRPSSQERLCLGMHRKQDWDRVSRCHDLREILPVWLRAGQMLATQEEPEVRGHSLLSELEMAIERGSKGELTAALVSLFRAGFHGLLVPTRYDPLRLGLSKPPIEEERAWFAALTSGARAIRSLFVQEYAGMVSILPLLPSELVSGRLLNAIVEGASLDLEWTKRRVRRMAIYCVKSQIMRLKFCSSIRKFRLTRGKNDRGREIDATEGFEVSEGETVWLDRFQH